MIQEITTYLYRTGAEEYVGKGGGVGLGLGLGLGLRLGHGFLFNLTCSIQFQ